MMLSLQKLFVAFVLAVMAFAPGVLAEEENNDRQGRKGRGGKGNPMRQIMQDLHKKRKEDVKKFREEQKAFLQSLKDMESGEAKAAINKRSEEVYNQRVKRAQETYDHIKTEIAKLDLPDEAKQKFSQKADERHREHLERIKSSNKEHTEFWLKVVDMEPEERKEAVKKFRETMKEQHKEAREKRKENRQKHREGMKRRRGGEAQDTEDGEGDIE